MSKPLEWLDGARASHAALIADLGEVDDKAARAPAMS